MRIGVKEAGASSNRKRGSEPPAGEVDISAALTGFTCSLKLTGINIDINVDQSNTTQPIRRKLRRCAEYLMSAIMTFWTAFIIYMFFTTFRYTDFNQVEKCFLVVVYAVSGAGLVIMLSLTIKRNRLRDLLLAMNDYSQLVWRYRPRITRRLRRGAIVYTTVPYMLASICLVATIVTLTGNHETMFSPEFDEYMMNRTVLSCDNLDQNDCISSKIDKVVIVGFLWAGTTVSVYWFCIGLILFTYYLIFLMLDSLERKFANHDVAAAMDDTDILGDHGQGPDPSEWDRVFGGVDKDEDEGCSQARIDRDARRFIRLHKRLCGLVHRANDCFQELNFALSFVEILVTIFMLRGMDFRSNRINVDKLLAPTIFMVVSFALRAILASKVNDQVFASMKSLLKIKPTPYNDCPSAETTMKIHQYVKFIQMTPPCLTGWGLYKVTDDSILTIAGYILTYTLTLYGIS